MCAAVNTHVKIKVLGHGPSYAVCVASCSPYELKGKRQLALPRTSFFILCCFICNTDDVCVRYFI
jgi:hypothetical protein